MESLIPLLGTLNSLSPLGIIALLGVIIFMLVKGKGEVAGKVDVLAENHLHDVGDSLRRIEALLQNVNDHIVYIRAKVNGN